MLQDLRKLQLTKDRQCRCIGISPRGLGLLLKSRQKLGLALAGDRCPLDVFPFGVAGANPFVDAGGAAAFTGVSPFRPLRDDIGLLLFVRARLPPLESELGLVSDSSSIGSGVVMRFRAVVDSK